MRRTLADHQRERCVIAKSVTIDRRPDGTGHLFIDGEDFPYHIAKNGPEIEQDGPFTIVWIPLIVDTDQD